MRDARHPVSLVAPVVAPNTGNRGQSVSFSVISSGKSDERSPQHGSEENHVNPSEKALSAGFANKAFRVEARGRQLNSYVAGSVKGAWKTMFPDSYPGSRLKGGPIQLVAKNDSHSFSPGLVPRFNFGLSSFHRHPSIRSKFWSRHQRLLRRERHLVNSRRGPLVADWLPAKACHPEASPSKSPGASWPSQ